MAAISHRLPNRKLTPCVSASSGNNHHPPSGERLRKLNYHMVYNIALDHNDPMGRKSSLYAR